ncbi:SCO family protein [Devosia nitrariae]|uniref:Electron transporter SCO1/SenC n=1 Tax=Devosia nitrariae TaxID=2071872 RepID=A0ABQ5W3J0_9HYPH|nr:SCO family protein [Devosia nitrariae]GLQ54408.1 electron transporter SCO1/SenC [Devosia nitrariae]
MANNPGLKSLRLGLWIAIGVLAVGTGLAALLLPRVSAEPVEAYGAGDYTLVDHDGLSVTQATFASGKPSLVFFGFTHCPEVCPTTLYEMATWLEALGPEGNDLNAFFVTVDPERDTPEMLKAYVTAPTDRVTGVTGEKAEIDKIVSAWHVHAERVALENGDYTMDHTASVFLVGPQGEFQGTIAYREASDTALGKIRNLLAKS